MSILLYSGNFEKGNRTGEGRMVKEADQDHVLYSGWWENDDIFAAAQKDDTKSIGWSQVGDHIYCGEFAKDGERHGRGILYTKEALENKEFKEAFASTEKDQRKYLEAAFERVFSTTSTYMADAAKIAGETIVHKAPDRKAP